MWSGGVCDVYICVNPLGIRWCGKEANFRLCTEYVGRRLHGNKLKTGPGEKAE